MIKLGGKLRVTGESGEQYFFDKYFFHKEAHPHFDSNAGVYLFLKKKNNGKFETIYCGVTNDMSQMFYKHVKGKCILKGKPNRVCFLSVPTEEERSHVAQDILQNDKYDFCCNTSLKQEVSVGSPL